MRSRAAPFPSIPLLRRWRKSDTEDHARFYMVLTPLIRPLSQTGYPSISNMFPQEPLPGLFLLSKTIHYGAVLIREWRTTRSMVTSLQGMVTQEGLRSIATVLILHTNSFRGSTLTAHTPHLMDQNYRARKRSGG